MAPKNLILALAILAFLTSLQPAEAAFGHITLLAVSETSDGIYEGSTADLYLEIKPGTGRVFIDTFPITKLDTQMTTRFSKELACKFLKKDCDTFDFFYTIKSQSSIVAGPSAGAATTILTISVLGKIPLDDKTVMTGTINSGYLIGHVGGLKEKIDAAAQEGMTKVLVPIGEASYEELNKTIDLVLYGRSLNITVVEVSDIYDAMSEFTGKSYRKEDNEIVITEEYETLMKDLAISLCNRTGIIKGSIEESRMNSTSLESTENTSSQARKEFEDKKYYSAASLCFGTNVNYLQEYLMQLNISDIEYKIRVIKAKREVEDFLERVKQRDANTITDLESNIIVRERLNDVAYSLELMDNINATGEKARLLAYSLERLNSAYLWDKFYGTSDGEKLMLDKNSLRESCQAKISEAEERYQYASIYFPELLIEIKAEINHAYDYASKEEYEFCLFKAAQAKARSNVILSSINVDAEKITLLLNQKLSAAKNVISYEMEKGIFPVLGYSYYEYANTLKENDELSALIYSEYSLELSDLDMYFKKPKEKRFNLRIDYQTLSILILGIVIGFVMHILIINARKKKEILIERNHLQKKNKRRF